MAKKDTPAAASAPSASSSSAQQPPNAHAQHPANCYYVPGSGSGGSGAGSGSSAGPVAFENPSKDSDYFSPGSLVECLTCYNVRVVGHVMAFEPTSRMLMLSKRNFAGL